MKPSLYLAGPIGGQTHSGATEWRDYVTEKLDGIIDCYSPLRAKKFAHGTTFTGSYPQGDPLWTDQGITTRDRLDVMRCDGLIVNFSGVTKVSIGTCIELGWADAWRKPVIIVMEAQNVHNHCMVRNIAGYIVNDIDEAIAIAKALFLHKESNPPHSLRNNVSVMGNNERAP